MRAAEVKNYNDDFKLLPQRKFFLDNVTTSMVDCYKSKKNTKPNFVFLNYSLLSRDVKKEI